MLLENLLLGSDGIRGAKVAQLSSIKKSKGLPGGGKARRIYLHLHEEIMRGVYAAGAVLPGEQKLAVTLDVSRVTVRRALDALEGDGLVERRAGSGTTVCAPRPQPSMVADFSTLMPQLVEMGQNTTARLLSFSYGVAPGGVARALGLDPKARVQAAVRLRLVEGEPFSHLTTWVPEGIAQNYTEAELATTPLFRLLERSGVKVVAAHQSVSATLASPEVAEVLGVSIGSPLLSLDRVVRDASEQGVEYLSALYRPDMFQLEMSLSHVGAGKTRHWEPVINPTRKEAAE
ncbi:transcriptional regulator [Octadecabacter antarcticus 307]|uniref:Transcriptional regulator n=1 Tax=Octadecabacter antarcticus 307 TaxID=391626 RepID=M9R8V3_9RHOB|nr:transcriptional regulator [Octadecabacter antarcticus 307]